MVQPTKLMWVPAEAAASGVTSVREGEAGRRDDRDQVAGEHVDREGVAEVELVHFRRSVHDVVLVGHPPDGRHRVQLESRNDHVVEGRALLLPRRRRAEGRDLGGE